MHFAIKFAIIFNQYDLWQVYDQSLAIDCLVFMSKESQNWLKETSTGYRRLYLSNLNTLYNIYAYSFWFPLAKDFWDSMIE